MAFLLLSLFINTTASGCCWNPSWTLVILFSDSSDFPSHTEREPKSSLCLLGTTWCCRLCDLISWYTFSFLLALVMRVSLLYHRCALPQGLCICCSSCWKLVSQDTIELLLRFLQVCTPTSPNQRALPLARELLTSLYKGTSPYHFGTVELLFSIRLLISYVSHH